MNPRLRVAVRSLGEILLTLGVVLLLFVAYELWFTNFYTQAQQNKLSDQIEQQWQAEPPPPTPHVASSREPTTKTTVPEGPAGSPYAIIWIPKFGGDYHFVVVNGVERSDLAKGPGHYPGTASPGQVGNLVISGHRTTHSHPFRNVDQLKAGDAMVIETGDAWYTYRVDSEESVLPTDMAVILPVPRHPDAEPTQALITLTTCDPPFRSTHRLIVYGHLDLVTPKAAGKPPALAGVA